MNNIMGKKVVLINPRKGWRPALGLLYIASYLREAGYNIKVIEFIDENYNKRKNKKLWQEFYKFEPDAEIGQKEVFFKGLNLI
jgi:hypothetical protein